MCFTSPLMAWAGNVPRFFILSFDGELKRALLFSTPSTTRTGGQVRYAIYSPVRDVIPMAEAIVVNTFTNCRSFLGDRCGAYGRWMASGRSLMSGFLSVI